MDKAKKLKQKREKLVKELALSKEMLQGTLVEKYLECGKTGCKCNRGQKHGPKYYLSYKFGGVTKMLYVPKDMLSEVKNQSWLYKKYKKAGQAISDINKQLLVISKKQR